jgi:hypothetical protein
MRTVFRDARAAFAKSLGRSACKALILSAVGGVGCQGRIGEAVDPRDPGGPSAGAGTGSTGTGATTGGGTTTGPTGPNCTAPSPAPSPVRRLTRFEYSNTLRDLLNDVTFPGDSLPPETKGNGFSNDAAQITTPRLLVDAYQSVAHNAASRAVTNAANLAKIAPCDTATLGEAVCSQQFVDTFGSRAFRRPLEADERMAFLGVFAAGRSGGAYADGIAAVIEMALQSPQFLYRVEFGVPVANTGVARPTSYEMASRLSYLYWGSLPDDTLLGAAKTGQLDTRQQVLEQATRMLADPRTREVVRYFHDTLYGIVGLDGLQRDTTFFPTYTAALGTLFRRETEQFLDSVVWDGPGDFATMFSGSYTFLNATLANFYGVTGVAGDAFQRVNLDPMRRAGFLTQASILTATTPGSHNNPVARGKFVYTQVLCQPVPDPPPGLNVVEPPFDPTRTTRERFIAHRTSPSCAGCHSRLDNIGFGFEHYNGVGLWQDLDNGKPIDDSGNVPDGDIAGDFRGAVNLADKIAQSHDARNCYVGQWLDFAYGRLEQQADACTRATLGNAFETAKGNVKSLLLALTQTDDFLYRPLTQP